MAAIDTVYLRIFLDPVNDAAVEHRKAISALEGTIGLSASRRAKAVRDCEKAEAVYHSAVGELIGGLNKLAQDAESASVCVLRD